MDFKSFKELEIYLQSKITESLQTDVAQDTKQLMKQHIESDVYSKYEPDVYIRRGINGGLLDDDNFLIEKVENGVSISNITKDNGTSARFGDFKSDPETWLIPIIEYGKGYSWTASRIYGYQPFPRPFIENTRKDLAKGLGKLFIKEALIKRGLKTQ